MRLHVHCSLCLSEYDVARQVIDRGRLTRPKLLTSLVEDIQRFGIRAVRPSDSDTDSAMSSWDTDKRKRQVILALRTAHLRLPELGDGRMVVSLNWWLDEAIAKAIYAHSASEVLLDGDCPVLDPSEVAQLFSSLLVERGLHFYTGEFSLDSIREEIACFLTERWDILWLEVCKHLDRHNYDLTTRCS